jgi:hypothetical protein
VIDDADDRGIHGRGLAAERLTGCTALEDDQHLLVHPGAYAVNGEQHDAAGCVVEIQRLDEQQLRALELAMLLRRDDRSNHAGDLHPSLSLRNCRIAGLQDCRKEGVKDCRKEGMKDCKVRIRSILSAILQSCNSAISSEVPVIDDADDPRVRGRLRGVKGKARLLAANDKHVLADAGADRVDRDERAAGRLTVGGHRLDDQQRDAREPLVLASDHDVADHAG